MTEGIGKGERHPFWPEKANEGGGEREPQNTKNKYREEEPEPPFGV